MLHPIRIGTRESQLAQWQATQVQLHLKQQGIESELVCVQSDGDIDLKTPLYEIGVQGIFTRALDIALLEGRVDLAVHSFKDVPVQFAAGIRQAAVLPRANPKDLMVCSGDKESFLELLSRESGSGRFPMTIATSSLRRKAQWLHRYPWHQIENLRGNVNTRLRKISENNWHGAIFAAAGLERINLRPANSIQLDWMLPAPAQGAILVVCRDEDRRAFDACIPIHDEATAICTRIERDFLRNLMGGCSTPIGALAEIEKDEICFRGNLLSTDGKKQVTIEKILPLEMAGNIGKAAADELLDQGGREIAADFQHAER
jgi:hydroxymethylbilane synthase